MVETRAVPTFARRWIARCFAKEDQKPTTRGMRLTRSRLSVLTSSCDPGAAAVLVRAKNCACSIGCDATPQPVDQTSCVGKFSYNLPALPPVSGRQHICGLVQCYALSADISGALSTSPLG
eukprot:1055113-Pleurochrysis_carterae.AAC.2